MLEEEFGCITYYMTDEIGKSGTFNPNSVSDKSKEFQQKLKEYKIDAVISGNCGCGICTVKETGNGLAAEYAGIPAVVVGAEAFVPQIESTGYNRGVPVVRTAAYPGAFASDTTEVQQKKAREILYPQIVTALTTQITQAEKDRIAGALTLPILQVLLLLSIQALNPPRFLHLLRLTAPACNVNLPSTSVSPRTRW